MTEPSRRKILGAAALGAGALVWTGALAQPSPKPAPQPQSAPPTPTPKFGYDDVVKRARDLASAPFDGSIAKLPDGLETLDFDAWRDIRFKPEKSFFAPQNSPFRMQLFHLGHLYRRAVTINTIRDGIATPIPYTAALWDYGRAKFDRQLPVNTGFAGFRLHFPINNPAVYDEVCSFVGASYFRFLGRGQSYGLSARALAVETGTNNEEFPFFREFWIETPAQQADHATFYALLDGASVTGAYRFDLYPGEDSVMEVHSTLFPRRSGAKFGIAPLTSMYFLGNNDRRPNSDFRTELHDSDGLQIVTQSGEWIWRPLRNPLSVSISSFLDKGTRGFGLLQRDRKFSSYQDLDLNYQLRPSYWVETSVDTFDGGRVELVELPTADETNDNIVASFVPNEPVEQGKQVAFNYRITASLNLARLSPNARTAYTFQAPARALGSRETPPDGSRRFLIDFSGGDLAYYSQDASLVEAVASISQGSVIRAFVVPNPHVKGIRAIVDVQVPQTQTGDIRVFLRAKGRTLTETWTFPWSQQQQ
ncbi:MAG: glucan biosynthesis protein G [Hyphomicrobiales bacterium]|nr:glucan biosynthesis protein G [Hyphomicrobiales bacterium]